jgi:hypothetical protein
VITQPQVYLILHQNNVSNLYKTSGNYKSSYLKERLKLLMIYEDPFRNNYFDKKQPACISVLQWFNNEPRRAWQHGEERFLFCQ